MKNALPLIKFQQVGTPWAIAMDESVKTGGIYKGRTPSVPVAKVKAMHAEGHSPSAIVKAFPMSRMSVHRVLSQV